MCVVTHQEDGELLALEADGHPLNSDHEVVGEGAVGRVLPRIAATTNMKATWISRLIETDKKTALQRARACLSACVHERRSLCVSVHMCARCVSAAHA